MSSALETFIHAFPKLRVVVDHGAKPPIRDGQTRLAKLG
jgi:L-fuconolactonase